MTIQDPRVLLVDNSANDRLLMQTVFKRVGFVQPLRYAVDGEDAIAYLRGDGAYADRSQFPLPTTMLLDLNMPKKNGFEVLDWVRQQPNLRRLRVYVLSASSRTEDIERAYDLGANAYLLKPSNLAGLTHLANTLVAWLQVSQVPPLGDPTGSVHRMPPTPPFNPLAARTG
jgi:CheY-like chemotaxis protein